MKARKSPPADAATPAGHAPGKVRYAVVGSGPAVEAAVLPAFAAATNSELAAVVSGDGGRRAGSPSAAGTAHAPLNGEFDRCLADPLIDAVYLALPGDLHVDAAFRAAIARKHILCEKPLALTVRDAGMMGRVADEYGVKLMAAYPLHFEPAMRAMIDVVQSGGIGEARYGSATFGRPVADRESVRLQLERGGGPVYDLGIDCINAFRALLQDEPIEVSALLARSADQRFDEVEETAAVQLRFPRGRTASFTVSFGASAGPRLELAGTDGYAILEPAADPATTARLVVAAGGKTVVRDFPPADPVARALEAFSRCILDDRWPGSSAEDAAGDLRVIEALFASATHGRTVKLTPRRKWPRAESKPEAA